MLRLLWFLKRCYLLLPWLATALVAAPVTTSPTTDVTAQAMSILGENCISCHNPQKKKGGLVLTSREAALQGGENGVTLVPAQPTKSPLLDALAADADPHMPPKGQLTRTEIEALRNWIDAGAPWEERLLVRATPATRPVTLRPLPATYHPVIALSLSPDQKRLAAGRGDHVLLFDLTQKSRPLIADRSTPNDLVQSLAWSADGRWLASGGYRRVRLWDLSSSQPPRELAGFRGRVTALCFTPDNQNLLTGEGEGGQPGEIRIWRIADGKESVHWEAHADAVLSMKLSPDSKLLVTGGADKQVKLWNVADHREITKLEGHTAQVMAVAVNRDSTLIASAGADKEIKVWDLKTHELTVSFQTHPAGVTDLQWVDDKVLLSTCEDGIARLNNTATKDRPQKQFAGAPDVLYCGVVSKDGTVFAGCHDGNVYLWSSATGKLEGTLPYPESHDK